MANKSMIFCFFAIFLAPNLSNTEEEDANLVTLTRHDFPHGFLFGAGGSAYQYEGAAHENGRNLSIWDTFTMLPGTIKDHSNGNVAVDTYHLYQGDLSILEDLGFNAYRLSISWSRLLPGGHLSSGINQEGLDYYNKLINDLVSKGIKPLVTISHWDLPQVLEDEYNGFLSPKVIDDFRNYAELCFKEFGDRVKHWITINEPQSFASGGYASGFAAPGRCSRWYSSSCTGGDSATEPYIVGHHEILAHAAAVKVYREKYQASQKGEIGITLDCIWMLPLTESIKDRKAASRMVAFEYDWFMEPLNSGSYPIEMIEYVGKRLPRFSREQSLMVKGSYDFIGLNYYTTYYASDVPCVTGNLSYTTDCCVNYTTVRNGIPIGPKAGSDWLYVYPKGILDLLLYTKNKYNNPAIYITENGYSEVNTGSMSLEDGERISYYKSHLWYLRKAIEMGVKVKGFFAWSLLDNFEWNEGYTIRFGIVFVDYKNGLQRYLKKSALWFKEFLQPAAKLGLLTYNHNSNKEFPDQKSTF